MQQGVLMACGSVPAPIVVDPVKPDRFLSNKVAQAARKRIEASPYHGLRCLSCEYHEGVLILRGRTSSYFHKQMAQETVRHVPGVQEICNAVEVVSSDGTVST